MDLYILSLLFIPIVFGFLFLLKNQKTYYKILTYLFCIFATSFSLIIAFNGPFTVSIKENMIFTIEAIIALLELAMLIYFFYVSIKHKKYAVLSVSLIQAVFFVYTLYNTFTSPHTKNILNIDYLSIIMLLVINVIGSLIVVFSNGYIGTYEKHRNLKSRQKLFYSVICIFIAAMNGLVVSDSLGFVYFFWEITTLASFLLISYNKDEEAYTNGFRALFLNIIGGIFFSLGIILLQNQLHINSFTEIVAKGQLSGIYLIPILLLCIAGFVKSAQMPFQSWLLGAMIAPTPVSALLHSSAMVKAGVFLIIKLSPAYAGTNLGTAIALYGGVTFVITSAIAVNQRNAKRVLAYSTISNLGLIICAAGLGTSESISAAIILILFHAISKALLFLCTGEIEHTIGSRDIEDMQGLIHINPKLALITCFGLISMILPPFGVLVTKLITIESASSNPIIAILLILGSTLTTLYYIKWMGSLLSYPSDKLQKQGAKNFPIYMPLWLLSIFALVTSIFIGPIYNNFIVPQMKLQFPKLNIGLKITNANVSSQIGSFNNLIVFIIIALLIVITLLTKKFLINNTVKKDIYMCGENISTDKESFRAMNGAEFKSNAGNLYLPEFLNEKKLTNVGYIISTLIILITIIGGFTL